MAAQRIWLFLAALFALFALIACGSAAQSSVGPEAPDVTFTLETGMTDGGMAFIGRGGAIDGVANPTLEAEEGDLIKVVLVNGDGVIHDIAFPDLGVQSDPISAQGAQTEVIFRVEHSGELVYYCSLPGHRQAGMEGRLIVGGPEETAPSMVSIVRDPTDLPQPVGNREPTTVRVDLEAVEMEGRLADGTSYTYWTFNGAVPGPFIRAREGDTVEVHLRNASDSTAIHSVDFHAATGYHGGGGVSQVAPGEEVVFTFKAMHPGLFVYHCATPSVAHHIASGMYGLILVEPLGGLEPVDREFYVMQGEMYTAEPFGTKGHQEFSHEKMLREEPEYFVLNGAAGALTEEYPLQAEVGDMIRIFFGVGGPNAISSFHVIGEVFDRVYDQASLTSAPLTHVQTTLVPPGGAVVVELGLDLPGQYLLVDHALSRVERGLAGTLEVQGTEDESIFDPEPDR